MEVCSTRLQGSFIIGVESVHHWPKEELVKNLWGLYDKTLQWGFERIIQ